MITLNLYRTILATVFLTSLGTVTIYQIGPIHFRPYQIPLLLSIIAFFPYLILHKNKILLPHCLKILSVFIVTILVSFWGSKFPVVTIKQFMLLSLYITICFLIINTCNSEKKLTLLHKTVIFSCFLVCIYGLITFIVTNLPGIEKEGGYWYTRPKSFFVEPNEFGLYLTFAFGYVFSELISGKKIINRTLLWITFLLIIFLIVPNMSRGSWFGGIAIIGVVLYYQNKFKVRKIRLHKVIKNSFFFLILSMISLGFVSSLIPTRGNVTVAQVVKSRIFSLTTGRDPTFLIRLNYNIKALKTMSQYPLIGIGFGNAFTILERGVRGYETGFPGIPEIGDATSSNFLTDIGVETGIIGLISFIFFLVLLLKRGKRTIKTTKNDKMLIIFIGAFASCVGLLVNGLTYPILLLPFFWISAGILSVRIIQK